MRSPAVYTACRLTIAFVWFYHGIFPKILGPARDELAMNLALGISPENAVLFSRVAGVVEIAIGACVLILWRRAWPLHLTVVLMLGLLGFVAVVTPELLFGAFNPVTINACVIVLAWVALRALDDQAAQRTSVAT